MNNANEFLEYIAANEKRLKKNLRKNITYDDDIFEDVFQTAILKVYDSIVRNDKWIDDFEQYFFISSKYLYILHDNRRKKAKAIHDDLSVIRDNMLDDVRDTERDDEIKLIVNQLTDYLKTTYGEQAAEIYLTYYRLKTMDKCSYQDISLRFGVGVKYVTEIIQTIRSDETLKEYYKKYKNIDNINYEIDNQKNN